jgi:predicted nuclease of predicted toxin-antitoxin system
VKLREFRLLTDENVDPGVVGFLRSSRFDVLDVCEAGLRGSIDADLLRLAVSEQRVVVTHDPDFGTLAILGGEPVVGIVYLRPGHIRPEFTIESVQTLLKSDPDLDEPFIVVVQRRGQHVTIRVRQL